MRHSWLIAAVASLSLAGSAPLAFSAPRNADRAQKSQRTVDKESNDRTDMKFDELPGNIKEVVGKQTGQGDKVVAVWKIHEKGGTFYHIRIQGDNGRARVLRVDEKGNFENDFNGTDTGNQTVKFDDLPGPTKETISKKSNGHAPKTVRQVTRDRKTWYVADVGNKTIYVDDNGEILRTK